MSTGTVGYIESIRSKVGHDPVFMPAAGCAVLDDAGRVLLQQRGEADGPWGLPGGAMELGESIEEAAVREVLEETGLRVRTHELVGVYTAAPRAYANGDVTQAVVVLLTATALDGELTVDGGETIGLGWFTLDDLPEPLFEPHRGMLDDLRAGRRGTWT